MSEIPPISDDGSPRVRGHLPLQSPIDYVMAEVAEEDAHDAPGLSGSVPSGAGSGIEWVENSQASQPSQVETKPKRKGFVVIAWLVIAAVVAFIAMIPMLVPDDPNAPSQVDLSAVEMQSKFLVGMLNMLPEDDPNRKSLIGESESLNQGPYINRLCYAVVVGELDGAKKATEALESTEKLAKKELYEPSESEEFLLDTLNSLYADYSDGDFSAGSVTAIEREQLKGELGWMGELALVPKELGNTEVRRNVLAPAQTLVVIGMFALLGGAITFGFGFIGLVTCTAMAFFGKLQSALVRDTYHGGIYAETFAVWLCLFLGLSIFQGIVLLVIPADFQLMLGGVCFFLSLSALFWPRLRGVKRAEIFSDIGWSSTKPASRVNPFVELVSGIACYAMALPLLGVGMFGTVILMALFGATGSEGDFSPIETPTHPIVEWLAEAGWVGIVQVFFLTAVAAPIVEETMFRGVLYRHLRDATRRWRLLISITASALFSGFIFAIIHPQGVFAVPALMSLAIGFSLAREWRGSLIAPMTMHCIHNSIVTLALVMFL